MRYFAISLDAILFDADADQLEWSNQAAWQAVGQSRRRALAGNLHILENPRGGRPITLTADPKYCFLSSALVAELEAAAALVGATHVLTLRPESGLDLVKTVMFDRGQGPFDLTPIDPFGDFYSGALYFIEV